MLKFVCLLPIIYFRRHIAKRIVHSLSTRRRRRDVKMKNVIHKEVENMWFVHYFDTHVYFYAVIYMPRSCAACICRNVTEKMVPHKICPRIAFVHQNSSVAPLCPSNPVRVGPILFLKNGSTQTKVVLSGPLLPCKMGPTSVCACHVKVVLFREFTGISSSGIKIHSRRTFHRPYFVAKQYII